MWSATATCTADAARTRSSEERTKCAVIATAAAAADKMSGNVGMYAAGIETDGYRVALNKIKKYREKRWWRWCR